MPRQVWVYLGVRAEGFLALQAPHEPSKLAEVAYHS